VNDISDARKLIGYCPQFDGIQPNMSGREHLWFYGRVRGVPSDEIEETVNALLDRMDLNLYASTSNLHLT
jgi:ABC-type multidrug transport system ATPase subunit